MHWGRLAHNITPPPLRLIQKIHGLHTATHPRYKNGTEKLAEGNAPEFALTLPVPRPVNL